MRTNFREIVLDERLLIKGNEGHEVGRVDGRGQIRWARLEAAPEGYAINLWFNSFSDERCVDGPTSAPLLFEGAPERVKTKKDSGEQRLQWRLGRRHIP